ncbi:MAG: preprotein translocase subunit SecY [Clostridiales bacterium]|nr:preprotein translocase subunit SecY [Clostridiales bacterium]
MFETIRNAWKIPDLRKKLLFTLFILLIYRFGASIPVPYIDQNALQVMFSDTFSNTFFGFMDVMSGGAFSYATVFALSIQPYINASIIMQLLGVAIPALERMQKDEGEEGKKKIASITRYVTVAIALLTGFAYYTTISNMGFVTESGFFIGLVIVLSFTAGSAFIMWLGEQITEFGIGNGISIILFTSIVSRFPAMVSSISNYLRDGTIDWYVVVIIGVLMVIAVAFVVFITNAERRIPVQYAKRVVGRKMYGGQSTHLPLKVNMSGVLPVIFAQSIATFPATIAAFFPAPKEGSFWHGVLNSISNTSLVYALILFILIIGFSYFYTAIQFNPQEIANNMKKNGGFIPGFRPGKPTSDFINKVLSKITLFGALFLAIIAITPIILNKVIDMPGLSIGGTSLLIVVGVALETVKELEAQMMMRHYKGFLE